jgi:hypothetical protein
MASGPRAERRQLGAAGPGHGAVVHGAGRFAPSDVSQRVAAPVGAQLVAQARAGLHGRGTCCVAFLCAGGARPTGGVGFGAWISQHRVGQSPHGPCPKGAQGVTGFNPQTWPSVPTAVRRCPRRGQRVLPGPEVVPVPIGFTLPTPANGPGRAAPRVAHRQRQRHRLTCKTGGFQVGRVHVQPTRIAMGHVHAHHSNAQQPKRERVTQVELVVDAGHQQQQQCGRQHPARACGQDVEVAVCQAQCVAGRVSLVPPAGQPMPGRWLRAPRCRHVHQRSAVVVSRVFMISIWR